VGEERFCGCKKRIEIDQRRKYFVGGRIERKLANAERLEVEEGSARLAGQRSSTRAEGFEPLHVGVIRELLQLIFS
jgi:hypothetical protein